MKQRVFIVHGWGATPEREWFPWLVAELTSEGVEPIVPSMPDTNHPQIGAWVAHLRQVVGDACDTDIFVGHSIGCQTILRYLQERNVPTKGLIFVAGWFTLCNLENDEEASIVKPWLETPVDFNAVRRVAGPITAVFSDTDPYVDLSENKGIFERCLGAQIMIEYGKGHFSEDDAIYELPVARDRIIQLIRESL